MPIKLPVKGKSSNKTQTLPITGLDNAPQKASPTQATQWYPSPFIDRLSIVLEPPTEQDRKDIYSLLMETQGDKEVLVDGGSKSKWKNYNWAKRVVLGSVIDTKKWPLLQCEKQTSDQRVPQLRIEFVPVDLGVIGLSELHQVLIYLTPEGEGWPYFIKHGKITRLDVAVDYPDVLVDDFEVLPQQGATTKQWAVDGKLETFTHGKPKGNCTAIYDRKTKRIAQKKSWINKQGMRIERRYVVPPVVNLSGLAGMPNPFAKMKMVSLPAEAPAGEKVPMVWQLFKRAVQVEGLPGALALLPKERRTLYRKHFEAHTMPWWDPDAIWANWAEMLVQSKIAETKAWG